MKRMLLWLWLLIKRQLKSPAMLVFLIGIPLITFIVTRIPAFSQNSVPRVALCAQDNDATAEAVIEQLVKGDYTVEFYRVASKEQMAEDVMSKAADHGYYFKGNLGNSMKSSDYEGNIVIFRNSAGFLESVTREIVFSEIFRKLAPQMAVDYILREDMFLGVREEAVEIVENRYKDYGSSGQIFYIDFDTVDDEAINGAADEEVNEAADKVVNIEKSGDMRAGIAFPIRGVLAVMVFVAGLYGGVWWLSEKRKSVCVALPQNMAKAGSIIYIAVPTVLFALSAEVALAVTGIGVYPYELIKMLVYVLAVVLYVWLFTKIVRSAKVMVTAIPVFAIASLVICPVFVNLGVVVPAVGYLSRLLLPYYYIMW